MQTMKAKFIFKVTYLKQRTNKFIALARGYMSYPT